MDLSYSSQEEAFRRRVRDFLEANLPPGWGSSGYAMPKGDAWTEFLRDWQRRLYDNGFLGLAWPKEYGGAGASAVQMAIFNEEQAQVPARRSPLNVLGLSLAGPTMHRPRHARAEKPTPAPKFFPAKKSGARDFPNPARARTWPRCAPGRSLRGDNSSSTARRYGPRWRISPTGACCWCAPIPPPPSIAGSAICWSI